MVVSFFRSHTFLLLLAFIIIGTLFRFYDLLWGAPFFFHPDERNIAAAISELQFPMQFNPHFFAYGSLPIYLVFFLGILTNNLLAWQSGTFTSTVSFDQAIFILRTFSAFFSVLLIPLLFWIGKFIKNELTGILAAFFAMTSIGLIQYAHFGTFELWLTFLGVLFFLMHLLFWRKKKMRYLYLQIFIFALLVSTKISSLALMPLLFFIPDLWRNKSIFINSLHLFRHAVLIGTVTLFIFLLTNPFSFLDFQSFYNSMTYESGVATGSLLVFYTGEFAKTLPVVYHFLHIYPFLLNPLLFALFLPSLLLAIILLIKQRSFPLFLILSYTLIIFLSQTFLYVKWTRYLIPTLPFIYLLIAFAIAKSHDAIRHALPKPVFFLGYLIIGTICTVFALAFIITVYVQEDTRVQAARFAKERIDPDANIVSEVYDLGIVPFSNNHSSIELFNFYDLDNSSPEFTMVALEQKLNNAEYLILPSPRILKSRLLKKDAFPIGAKFYSSLFSGKMNFSTLFITPCDIWCKITYWGDPIFAFEGTVNIFDRPTVLIYERIDK